MERHIKQIRRTLGLLSSMVRSGENHSDHSEKALRNSLNGLEQLDLYIVSNRRELLPEFLMKDSDGKIVTAYIGGADVTEEWNEYLGNCG